MSDGSAGRILEEELFVNHFHLTKKEEAHRGVSQEKVRNEVGVYRWVHVDAEEVVDKSPR